jgi:hypothetical protein
MLCKKERNRNDTYKRNRKRKGELEVKMVHGDLNIFRPFTHSHFFRYGEKVEGQEKDILAIVQTQARPPHYVVQVSLASF